MPDTRFFGDLGLSAFLQSKNKAARAAGASLPAPEFPTIESLEGFDWKTTEPIKIRPFKPKYHLTMGMLALHA